MKSFYLFSFRYLMFLYNGGRWKWNFCYKWILLGCFMKTNYYLRGFISLSTFWVVLFRMFYENYLLFEWFHDVRAPCVDMLKPRQVSVANSPNLAAILGPSSSFAKWLFLTCTTRLGFALFLNVCQWNVRKLFKKRPFDIFFSFLKYVNYTV